MTESAELVGVMTKEELLGKVNDYELAEPVDVELGPDVEFSTDEDNHIVMYYPQKGKKEQTVFDPPAFSTLASSVGLPRPYLKKIPVEQRFPLVIPHLNYWFGQALAGNMLRLMNVGDRTIMIAPKANFEHIRISTVINAAERQLGKENILGFHKFWSDQVAFYFSILTTKSAQAVKDDTLFAGIRVRHSLLAETSTKVSAYVFRQWCSNGATTEDTIDTWRRRSNSGDDLETWLQKSVREADKVFDTEVDRLRKLSEIPTSDHTAEILNSVLAQSSVPQGLQKEVRSTLIDRPADNLYDLYNVLTEIDTHSDYFTDHQGSKGLLNNVASHLSRHSELCPVCHRQV